MVLSSGGPTTHGKWFFTDVGPYPNRHTLGSLNYYKGNTTAIFSGVGEVLRRGWRDGSRVLCGSPPPPPVCFPVPYANFDIVELSLDGGATWTTLFGSAGSNNWGNNITVSGTPYHFATQCGVPIANGMGLRITNNGSLAHVDYPATSVVTTYPATWTVPTVAGSPPPWPGTTILMRTRCSSGGVGLLFQGGANLPSLSLSIPTGMLAGDTLLSAYFQNGGDVSGLALPVPTISSGWTNLFAAGNKRSYLWSKLHTGGSATVTISGIAAADLQSLYFVGARSIPGLGVVATLFKPAQAAATALTSGSLTLSGGPGTLYSWFVQTRDALTFQASPGFSLPLSSFAILHSDTRQAAGATPIFETKADIALGRGPVPAGAYSTGITSSRSLGWDSIFVACR